MPQQKKRRGGAGAAADDDDAERARAEADDAEDAELQERLERRRRERESRLSEMYAEFAAVATDEQVARFEQYKRSRLPRAAMRKLMSGACGSSNERCGIVLASLAKMFVGELVEGARERMTAAGERGPVQPHHLRAAYRAAQAAGVVPHGAAFAQHAFWRG